MLRGFERGRVDQRAVSDVRALPFIHDGIQQRAAGFAVRVVRHHVAVDADGSGDHLELRALDAAERLERGTGRAPTCEQWQIIAYWNSSATV